LDHLASLTSPSQNYAKIDIGHVDTFIKCVNGYNALQISVSKPLQDLGPDAQRPPDVPRIGF
jgi:hypothetical protein